MVTCAGFVGPWVALCRLPGVPGQHEAAGGVIPGNAGYGDEERGVLCCQGAQLRVSLLESSILLPTCTRPYPRPHTVSADDHENCWCNMPFYLS